MKNTIKGILLSVVTGAGLVFGGLTDKADASVSKLEVEQVQACEQNYVLEENQTELFFMYSDEYGSYLIDPKAEYENVIYVGHDDFLITKEQAHHGNKFIGTFDTEYDWELIDLEVMNEDAVYCNDELNNGLKSNETTLFYMYSNKEGHYLLDMNAQYENVVFVGNSDMPDLEGELVTGKWFVGIFEDSTLWDLESLEEVVFE